MSDRRLSPPGGEPPPATVTTDSGEPIDLRALAEDVCRRYRREFSDEEARYGEAGQAWCIHDNQYLLAWAVDAADGHLDMRGQVAWLASILEARDFPLERLARDLEIGVDVVREHLPSGHADAMGDVLTDAARYVRSRGTFLE